MEKKKGHRVLMLRKHLVFVCLLFVSLFPFFLGGGVCDFEGLRFVSLFVSFGGGVSLKGPGLFLANSSTSKGIPAGAWLQPLNETHTELGSGLPVSPGRR